MHQDAFNITCLHRKLLQLCGCLLGVFALFVGPGTIELSAQSVHPEVYLSRPTATTYTRLSQFRTGDKPKVGLYYSRGTIELNQVLAPTVEEAVKQWELLLVGMELPYVVLEDTSLVRAIDDNIELLIMPGAEVLSDQHRAVIRTYLKQGGGLIASGRLGFFDERGVLQNDRFYREIFSAEPSIDLPDSLNGLIQVLQGGHPPTNGIAPGFKLNVSRPALGMAVLPLESQPMGYIISYQQGIQLIEDAFNVSTLLLKGEYGAGRFVWFGFNPQDVSLEEQQQAVYQGLVLNSMAYVAGVPALSVRRWPHGFTSASSFAVLPTLGYRPYAYRIGMDLVLGAMERAKVKSTYFMIADRATDHPDLLERIYAQGEIALTSDTDAMLAKQPEDQQYNRIRIGIDKLTSADSDVSGFYPPGGFYDPNTLRAMIDLNLDYMLSDAKALNVPVFLKWEDELDYRDVLLAIESDSAFSEELAVHQIGSGEPVPESEREIITFHPSLYSYALDDRSGVSGPTDVQANWSKRLEDNFQQQHSAEGLFLFAFEPETMGLTQQRAQVLEDFGRFIRTQNTWIATLDDMAAWWSSRRRVSVEISKIDAEGYTFQVENAGDEHIEGLSIDFYMDGTAHRILDLKAGGLDVWSKRDRENMLLVIEDLPPGTHQIRLEDPAVSAQDTLSDVGG